MPRDAGSARVGRPLSPRLWQHREAADVRVRDQIMIAVLAAGGAVAVLRLLDWWFRPAHVTHAVLFALLSLAFWYGISRIVIGWVNYLAIARPAHRPAPPGLGVAIFTTSSPGEPLAMFEKTLAACARLRYPHTTYLLDDTRDPRFREVAERHDTVWIEMVGVPGAKAGKINRALELTSETFILVLDPDHLVFPQFFDRVLGHFDDPRVGFVQVAQAYYNQARSFTAAGAAEQTYGFYGPGQMGLHGHGAAVAIGANCTFRRSALASIGGHGIGLAEDLITAIRLHAAGWRSVYVPEVLSRGLVPEDLGSFFRQQLKWSRGVYEVVFSELPRHWHGLRWRQKLAYLTVGTYYLNGVTTAVYIVFPYLYIWTGVQAASMWFGEFLTATAPVAAVGVALYLLSQRWLCDRSTERGLHLRGLMLKIACWPVYVRGTALAIGRVDVPYVPTAKEAVARRFLDLAWPQLLLIGVYVSSVIHVAYVRLLTGDVSLDYSPEAVWGMLAFASLPAMASVGALYAAWESRRLPDAAPWDAVDVAALGREP